MCEYAIGQMGLDKAESNALDSDRILQPLVERHKLYSSFF